MFRNPVIVHISDLHFGPGNHNQVASQQLAAAIRNTFPLPDFLVVTGDLAQWGTREEMQEAKDYLMALLDGLWQDYRQAARCIVVPGNHDLLRSAWKLLFWRDRLGDFNEIFGDWGFTSEAVPASDAEPVKPATLEGFYRKTGQVQPTPAERATAALRVCEYFPRFQTAFLKINSNVKKSWWLWNIAKGYVGPAQLAGMDQVVDDLTKAFPGTTRAAGFREARLIALLHHHMAHLRHAQYEEKMLMTDAGEVWQRLCKMGCEMVLHGHRHNAAQLGMSFWDSEGKEFGTTVLAAGSATANDTDDGHNSYYRIYTGSVRTEVSRPALEDSRFTEPGKSHRITFSPPFDLELDPDLAAELPIHAEALRDSLLTDEDIPDRVHRYESLTFTGVIDDALNYHGCYLLDGRNISGIPTQYLPFSLTAVGAHTFQQLQVRALDLLLNQPIVGIGLLNKLRPINAFPIRIPFTNPVGPGQPFRIRICFLLPQVMLEEADFDMVNLVRYRRGVRKIVHRLLATKKIVEPVSLAIRGKRVVRTGLELEPVEGDFGALVPGTQSGTLVKGYQLSVEDPDAVSYLLYYRRLV
jgi:3',5'-cyclic AMP phosphodiesterase CpdA